MDDKIHKLLYGLEYGAECDRDCMAMTDEKRRSSIAYSPPHMRNAMVGILHAHMYTDFGTSYMLDHFIMLATEHLTILPLKNVRLGGHFSDAPFF